MNLRDAIRQLTDEKQRVERAIEELERLLEAGGITPVVPGKSNRGRKSMGAEERKIVGERMRQYWAKRRQRQPE